VRRAWVEEAQAITKRSLSILTPTIRAEGSEIWFGWNPRRQSDPVDKWLRGDGADADSIVVKANWRDNPWWNDVLEGERQKTLRADPDQYDHIWEGGYQVIAEGAYYARQLAEMRAQGRLGRVSPDPLMTYRAFWDIGGTGAKSDAAAIWVVQFVGREIRVLDYYEAQGQPLAAHIGWLRGRGYEKALCVLPHDGATYDRVHAVSYEGALRSAGFAVQVVPNQGRGAASMRIEAARRLFPSVWVNEETTRPGMLALGAYHPRVDSKREVDLGPEHDWASHAADAWGLMAVAYEAPREKAKPRERPQQVGSWMAA
jgi:phage terminase large subunit